MFLLIVQRDNVIFAATKHGGHLGYFEGGFIKPNDITWLDRVVVEFCKSLIHMNTLSCGRSLMSSVDDVDSATAVPGCSKLQGVTRSLLGFTRAD